MFTCICDFLFVCLFVYPLVVCLLVCLFVVVYSDDVWLDELLSKEKLEDLLAVDICDDLDMSDIERELFVCLFVCLFVYQLYFICFQTCLLVYSSSTNNNNNNNYASLDVSRDTRPLRADRPDTFYPSAVHRV